MTGFEAFIPQPIHHLSASTSGLAAGGGARQGGKPHPAGGPAHPHYVSRHAAGLRTRCRRKRKWAVPASGAVAGGGLLRGSGGVRAGNGRAAGGGCSRLAAVAAVGPFSPEGRVVQRFPPVPTSVLQLMTRSRPAGEGNRELGLRIGPGEGGSGTSRGVKSLSSTGGLFLIACRSVFYEGYSLACFGGLVTFKLNIFFNNRSAGFRVPACC